MKIIIKDNIDERKYDLLFKTTQILEKIGIEKYLGDKIIISDFEVANYGYSFSVDDGYKPIDVDISVKHNGRIINVTLYMVDETVVEFELDHNYKNILSYSITRTKEDRTVSKRVFYQKNSLDIYTYELIDYNKENILVKFKSKNNETNYEIYNYLLNNSFDKDKLIALLKESYNVEDGILKVTKYNEEVFYQIRQCKVIFLDEEPYIEDPVMIKVYKYN